MQAVLSITVAATLTVQTVFGLCWERKDACAAGKMTAKTTAGCRCHEQTPTDRPVDSPSGCPGKGCQLHCRGICTFLPSERVQLDEPGQAFIVTLTPLDSPTPYEVGIECRGNLFTSHRAEFPVRLHLAHQLLLI